LINHYDILGLKPNAGHADIKLAFRQLAKLYHPDKNPEGIEQFEKILKAYEVLSDPVLKAAYDYKLDYHLSQAQKPAAKAATTKTWSFDEKEMKRRQYFNENYKKSNRTTEQYAAEMETKKSYNEYKYIFFATPIAVILFLLIMKLAMPVQPTLMKSNVPVQKQEEPSQLSMGDMPYANFFGGTVYDPSYTEWITVKNETGREVIVCLFTKTTFVRSFYICKDYFAQVRELPDGPLFMRYFSGKIFKFAAKLKVEEISGAFTKDPHFFKSKGPLEKDSTNAITLLPGVHKNFIETDEAAFFKKINNSHDKKN
jgi:hypothetical protein